MSFDANIYASKPYRCRSRDVQCTLFCQRQKKACPLCQSKRAGLKSASVKRIATAHSRKLCFTRDRNRIPTDEANDTLMPYGQGTLRGVGLLANRFGTEMSPPRCRPHRTKLSTALEPQIFCARNVHLPKELP